MDFKELYLIIISAITFGYVTAAVLVETNVVNWIGLKTLKLSRFGIHPKLTNIPVIYLVSPRAAHMTASELLKKGEIEPIDLYLAILASNFPMRLMFLYRYYLPVLLPLIGSIAVYYALLRLFFDLVVLICVSIIGRIRYRNLNVQFHQPENVKITLSFNKILKGTIRGLKESGLFILKFTPLFVFIIFLINNGAMDWLTTKLKPFLGWIGFTPIEITYITTAAISPPVAYGLIRVMVEKGETINRILGTMAVGNAMFSLLRSWWNYLLPYYLGLYPLRITAALLLLQAGLPIIYNFTAGIVLIRW